MLPASRYSFSTSFLDGWQGLKFSRPSFFTRFRSLNIFEKKNNKYRGEEAYTAGNDYSLLITSASKMFFCSSELIGKDNEKLTLLVSAPTVVREGRKYCILQG
jgi:hypothetical protein